MVNLSPKWQVSISSDYEYTKIDAKCEKPSPLQGHLLVMSASDVTAHRRVAGITSVVIDWTVVKSSHVMPRCPCVCVCVCVCVCLCVFR